MSIETLDDVHKPAYIDERQLHCRVANFATQLKMDFKIIKTHCDIVINNPNPLIEAFIFLFNAAILYNCPFEVISYIEPLYNLDKPKNEQIVHEFYDYKRWSIISVVCLMIIEKLKIGKIACERAVNFSGIPHKDDINNLQIYKSLAYEFM